MPAHETDRLKLQGQDGKYPGAFRKFVNNCKTCCKCQTQQSKLAQQEPYRCKHCICKCFGFFAFQDWNLKENFSEFPNCLPLGDFENTEVSILYREDIKVFYKKVQDAEKDGYTNFNKSDFLNENGYLYSFTGLRGDAKELYRRVTNNLEPRLKLIKALTTADQTPHINSADLVIWACGYQTNGVPIYEMNQPQVSK